MRNLGFGISDCRLVACGLAGRSRSVCAPHAKPQAAGSSNPKSQIPNPQSRRCGVTLVELLITIAIIAILATAILGVAAVATTTAREARTRNTITRLHTLLTEHYDTYRVRRVKLNRNLEADINNRFANNPRQRGEALAQARLYALRELMLMEMPNGWAEVVLGDPQNVSVGAAWTAPLYYAERPGLSSLYRRNFERLLGTATPAEISQNEAAECLYLTIMYACGDGESRAQFSENDIGDSDGDGAAEFLDAWGKPIVFIRWAPGFESDAQLNPYQFANSEEWIAAAAIDHDPFDLFRRDRFAFRLVPLIMSAGNDELYGMDARQWVVYGTGVTPANPNSPPYTYFTPPISPYEKGSLPFFAGTQINSSGQRDPADATDNIHNHLIGTR